MCRSKCCGKKGTCSLGACNQRFTNAISGVFRRYGEFVARWPLVFIFLNLFVFGGLAFGLAFMEEETSMERVYFPKNSRAIHDRETVRDTFPDISAHNYNPFSLSDNDVAVQIIFRCSSGRTIFDSAVTAEIERVVNGMKTLSSTNTAKSYNSTCARDARSQCVVDGEFVLSAMFQGAVANGVVTWPSWNSIDITNNIAGVQNNDIKTATVLKLSFKLADSDKTWMNELLTYLESLSLTETDIAYEAPNSLNDELDKSTKGDIVYFSLTITLVCTYASVVSTGGNPVSTRAMLAFGGILAAGLGIVGSMGLLSAVGVNFVNIVGVMPFLIIGIGVDDMFLMMSAWSESLPSNPNKQTVKNVPSIVGQTLASAGIGITITSVTDFLAFAIGSFSVFRSVTNFSWYAGVAVLFCYLSNATLFTACLALHGRRVYAKRHTLTCCVTKSRADLERDGRSACCALLCGGTPPQKAGDDHSVFEKLPSTYLPRLFKKSIVSVAIIVFFLFYLAAAIYGTLNLKQGLLLQDLVLDKSYYHTFLTYTDEYFPMKVPIAFAVTEEYDYAGGKGDAFLNLLGESQKDSGIDDNFSRCWLQSYRYSSYFNLTAPGDFVGNLGIFLDNSPEFQADVVLNRANTSVLASRCFVMSKPNKDQYANAELMERMRELVDSSPLPALAYHSSFVAFEQFLAVLPATLQLVGIAVAVMTVVTFVLLQHPFMVLLVVVCIVMILVGIFGSMYFWGLTLSSITMIHLVMSVGFSVDFSAHVCTAYLLSASNKRQDRAADAIRHAAAPIFNGAISTLLGILLLLASQSYIFLSFFKVMLMVILLGLIHAVFFLPSVLSILGPEIKDRENKRSSSPTLITLDTTAV